MIRSSFLTRGRSLGLLWLLGGIAASGGIMGGIVGAGIAVQTKHADIVLPAGTHVLVTLAQRLTTT